MVIRFRSALREPALEGALAARSERDRAGAPVPARPAESEDAIEDRRAERTPEVVAAFAPVEAEAADRAPRLGEQLEIHAELFEESFTLGGDERAVASGEDVARAQLIEEPYAAVSREM